MSARRLALALGFLLGLGWALSRPAPAYRAVGENVAVAVDDTLPPLPDSVTSAMGMVPVHRVKQPFHCGKVLAWGCYTYETHLLQVATGLDRETEWRVLFHEEVHMALGDAEFIAVQRGEPAWVDDSIADIIADLRFRQGLAQGVH